MDRPSFTHTKWRAGYAIDDVDAFVQRAIASLEAQHALPMTSTEVQDVRFTPVLLRSGYDMGEVDAWLDALAARLSEFPEP